jgi:GNAT superfamily N-acetyltransferase
MISSHLIYRWNTSGIPSPGPEAPTPLRLIELQGEPPADLLKLAEKACCEDTSLGSPKGFFQEYFEEMAERASDQRQAIHSILLRHGERMIGASLLDTNPDAENHLLTGPCVLHEYQGRGLGSLLFHRSLLHLAGSGVKEARGFCLSRSKLDRYVYAKFGGISESRMASPKAQETAEIQQAG